MSSKFDLAESEALLGMKKTALFVLALCGVAGTFAGRVSAQNPDQVSVAKAGAQVDGAAVGAVKTPAAKTDDTAAEVEALRKRVEEVERQISTAARDTFGT